MIAEQLYPLAPSPLMPEALQRLPVSDNSDGLPSLWVTPAMALLFITEHRYSGQRNLLNSRVDHARRLLRTGRYLASVITFALYRGLLLLMNGYHRCEAAIKEDVPFKVYVQVVSCETEEELHALALKFDHPISRRSDRDNIHSVNAEGQLGISDPQAQDVQAAAAFIYYGLVDKRQCYRDAAASDPTMKIRMLAHWTPYYQEFCASVLGRGKPLSHQPMRRYILGPGMMLMRYAPDRARVFFAGVAANNQSDPNSPERRCNTCWLTSNGFKANLVVAEMADCWNAYVKGRRVRRAKADGPEYPLFLGTPWDGATRFPLRLLDDVGEMP